jgi:hypothetical protein
MNKIKLEVSALIDKFQHHDQLKDHLVDLIDKADNDTEMKVGNIIYQNVIGIITPISIIDHGYIY